MKIDWINVFMVGFFVTAIVGIVLLIVFIGWVMPWIIMNWILVAGVALLIGLILMAIAYYKMEALSTNE